MNQIMKTTKRFLNKQEFKAAKIKPEKWPTYIYLLIRHTLRMFQTQRRLFRAVLQKDFIHMK